MSYQRLVPESLLWMCWPNFFVKPFIIPRKTPCGWMPLVHFLYMPYLLAMDEDWLSYALPVLPEEFGIVFIWVL